MLTSIPNPIYSPRIVHCAASLLLILLSACGNVASDTFSQITDPGELYAELRLNHNAVLLATTAPYDTIMLTATPVNSAGDPLLGVGARARYHSTVKDVAFTDTNGIVRAVTPGTVIVIATLTVGNVTHTDSVLVEVRDVGITTPPVLTTFSVHPIPPDSAKRATYCSCSFPYPELPPQARDENGAGMSVPVHYRSSDPTIVAFIHQGVLTPFSNSMIIGRVGSATLYASTTAFGVTKTDTVQYRVGESINGLIDVAEEHQPGPRIGVGGYIGWQKSRPTLTDLDVVFADPTYAVAPTPVPGTAMQFIELLTCSPEIGQGDCNAGNIVGYNGFSADSLVYYVPRWAVRSFAVPGRYHYNIVARGTSGPAIASGWVTVVEE